MDLRNLVNSRLSPIVRAGQTVTVGLSGGMDSVVLLHVLDALKDDLGIALSALHVNHQISPNAAAWEKFSAELCSDLGVPFRAERVSVARGRGESLEAVARQLRYSAFSTCAGDFVALAHHLDDQIETFLIQLLRGCGVAGLSGMPFRRPFAEATSNGVGSHAAGPQILRPLLDVSREMMLDYAHRGGLRWIEDESNLDLSFDRNYLRHEIIPRIATRFPGHRKTFARAARLQAEAADLLEELARQDEQGVVAGKTLDIGGLRALQPARARNLLRYFLNTHAHWTPPATQLDETYRQLTQARADATPHLKFGQWEMRRFRDRAYLIPAVPPVPAMALWRWNGEARLALPALEGTVEFEERAGEGISRELLRDREVTFRLREGGERLRLRAGGPRRDLKKLFQEIGVVEWERGLIPLMFVGDRLVAVPGIGVESDFQARPGEPSLVVKWTRSFIL